MAESVKRLQKRVRQLKNRLWGIIDLATRKPCREPVETNEGTTFVIDSILQTLSALPQAQRQSGFLGVAGECRFLRTQFPLNLLSMISGHVDHLVRSLTTYRSESAVGIAGDRYQIQLIILPSRDLVRDWIENQAEVPLGAVKPLAPSPNSCETSLTLNNTDSWRVADFSRVLDQLIGQLPPDPREQLRAISELYAELQQRIAPKLAPTLAEILRTTHELSYDEKADLAHEINAVLADARLAIRDPKTNLPATLLAQRPKVSGPTSYMRIWDTRKANDGKRHYFKVEDLGEGAELKLIDERNRSSDRERS